MRKRIKHCQVGKCQVPHDYYWYKSGIKIACCHKCYEMLGGKRPKPMSRSSAPLPFPDIDRISTSPHPSLKESSSAAYPASFALFVGLCFSSAYRSCSCLFFQPLGPPVHTLF